MFDRCGVVCVSRDEACDGVGYEDVDTDGMPKKVSFLLFCGKYI